MDKISALVDGELSEQETRNNLSRLKQNMEYCETWAIFHMIGDAMRGEPVLKNGFTNDVCARLAVEPTVMSPWFTFKRVLGYTLSVAASLTAVAFVLTLVMTTENPFRSNQQVAQITPAMASKADEARINDYLLAHQEFSPSTTLQGVAPYVRAVADDQMEDR